MLDNSYAPRLALIADRNERNLRRLEKQSGKRESYKARLLKSRNDARTLDLLQKSAAQDYHVKTLMARLEVAARYTKEKPTVVDRTNRVVIYDVNPYEWEKQMEEVALKLDFKYRSSLPERVAVPNTFDVDAMIRNSRSSEPSLKAQEVRGGVRVFNPKTDRIPTSLFTPQQRAKLSDIVRPFSARPTSNSLDLLLRTIRYTGAKRLDVNPAMAALIQSHIGKMKTRLRGPDLHKILSEASFVTTMLNYVPPQPTRNFPLNTKKSFTLPPTLRREILLPPVKYSNPRQMKNVTFSPAFLFVDGKPHPALFTKVKTIADLERFSEKFNYPMSLDEDGCLVPALPVEGLSPTSQKLEFQMSSNPTIPAFPTQIPGLTKLFAFIYLLKTIEWRFDTWTAAFVTYISDDSLSFLLEMSTYLLKLLFSKYVVQDSSSFLNDLLLSPWSKLASTKLGRSCWDLFSMFSIHSLLSHFGVIGDKTLLGRISQMCAPHFKRIPGQDSRDTFLSHLLEFGKVVIVTIRDCITSGSISPLFELGYSINEWTDACDFIMYNPIAIYNPGDLARSSAFLKMQEAGKLPRGITVMITQEQQVLKIEENILYSEKLLQKHSEETFLLALIMRKRVELVEKKRLLEAEGPKGAFRIAPYGILIPGRPGIGKTVVCREIHQVLARSTGQNPSAKGIMRFDGDSNFADGWMDGQQTILFDDADAKMGAATLGSPDPVSSVNKYGNTAPLNVEAARVEDKGLHWANFTLMLFTTNYDSCRLSDYTQCPAMFWRRFPIRLILIVKPEYATASGAIDGSKVFDENQEIHDYSVELLDHAALGGPHPFEPPYKEAFRFGKKSEFFRWLSRDYRTYYEREKLRVARANRDETGLEICQECFRPKIDHSLQCLPEYQMEIVEEEPSLAIHAYAIASVTLPLLINLAFIGYGSVSLTRLRYFMQHGVVLHPLVVFTVFLTLFVAYISSTFSPYYPAVIGLILVYSTSIQEVFENLLLKFPSTFLPIMRLMNMRMFVVFFEHLPLPLQERMLVEYVRISRYQKFCSTFRAFSRERTNLVLMGITIALGGLTAWTLYTREQEEYQIDLESPFSDYRAPHGIPKGTTPYVRVMRPEEISDNYGIRATPPTFTFSEFEAKIRERLCLVRTRRGSVHGFRIKGSLIITNSHPFCESIEESCYRDEGITDMSVCVVVGSESYTKHDLRGFITRIPGKDLVILHFPEIPPLRTKWDFPSFLCDKEPLNGMVTDSTWLVSRDKTLHSPSGSRCAPHPADRNGLKVWMSAMETRDGDCSSVLVGLRGPHFSIIGFHTAFLRGPPSVAIAESLSRSDFDFASSLYDKVGGSLELNLDPRQITGRLELPVFQCLPRKSSLRTTLTQSDSIPQLFVLGTLPGMSSSTMKSKCIDTIFRNEDRVQQLERSYGLLPHFQAPKFRGCMINDRWVDGFTVGLEASSNLSGQAIAWEKSLEDFLDGASAKAQDMRMTPLSDHEAFFGVPGTVIGGTNMQSSAGPPFSCKKTGVIAPSYDFPTRVSWDAGFQKHVEEIERVIRSGDLYSPYCVHVLKDEVLTSLKNEKRKVRVFNILPFAFNHVMKKFLSPLTAFTRQHAFFFENVVGMNICDPSEAEELYGFVSKYPNVLAFDKSSFDAKCSTFEHIMVSRFYYELSLLCGYTRDDADFVFRLCLSSIYPLRSIKGDFFMMSHSMPSGFWMTIHFNCVRSSLQARYAWFRLCPGAPSFRSCVNQVVLGDDLLACVRPGFSWYSQPNIAIALEEIGAVATSCRKEVVMADFEKLSEVQFLKRTPRFVRGRPVWALDEKTLVKMLCMRVSSHVVGKFDAHAMLLTNVLSEVWMWGEERFAFFLSLVEFLVQKYGLRSNNYLRILSFEEYFLKYTEGELTPWQVVCLNDDTQEIMKAQSSVSDSLYGAIFQKPTHKQS